jgi:hypothetical protein
MSLELMFVIGLWVLALAMTGVSILQEVRARQLRERVARLVRTRTPTEEEMPTEMPEDEELRQSIAQRLFRAFLLPWIQRLSRLLPQSGATLKGTEELLAMAGYPFGLTASDFMGLRLLCTFVGTALGVLLPIPLSLWRPDFLCPVPSPFCGDFGVRRFSRTCLLASASGDASPSPHSPPIARHVGLDHPVHRSGIGF